jgi:hypothetical protein
MPVKCFLGDLPLSVSFRQSHDLVDAGVDPCQFSCPTLDLQVHDCNRLKDFDSEQSAAQSSVPEALLSLTHDERPYRIGPAYRRALTEMIILIIRTRGAREIRHITD